MTPTLLSMTHLSSLLNRSPATVYSYIEKGLAPVADESLVDHQGNHVEGLWRPESVREFYSRLHPEQGALVPANVRAQREFEAYGVYACPAHLGGFIGLARPVVLGLKHSGDDSQVNVYEVSEVATDSPLSLDQSTKQMRSILRALQEQRDDCGPLTIFLLSKQIGSFRHLAPLRQGRVVGAATLRAAVQRGSIPDITWDTALTDIEGRQRASS